MRIAFLSSQHGFSGGEVHLLQLARGLALRGHDVSCCVVPGDGLAPRLAAAGLAVETVPLVDWFEPCTTARVVAWLRRGRPQILHTHCPRDHYLAAVATLGSAVCNVGTRHQLRPLGARWLKRPFLRRFAAMIAVSEAVRRALVTAKVLDPARVFVVPNGVDTARSLPARDGLRRILGLGPDVPVVGYVGRLSPEKGVDTLLKAVARLRRAGGVPARLFVVGHDPCPAGRTGAALRDLAAALGVGEATHFFGWIEDAAAASADFDIHVIPSLAEPFGLATLEGMAHGHAVVTTASGGSPELVRDGVDGLLVPPGDPAALAAGLARLLADPALRARLGAQARRRVERDFSLARMLDGAEEVYARALAVGGPG